MPHQTVFSYLGGFKREGDTTVVSTFVSTYITKNISVIFNQYYLLTTIKYLK